MKDARVGEGCGDNEVVDVALIWDIRVEGMVEPPLSRPKETVKGQPSLSYLAAFSWWWFWTRARGRLTSRVAIRAAFERISRKDIPLSVAINSHALIVSAHLVFSGWMKVVC
jgi:hypothetical protein